MAFVLALLPVKARAQISYQSNMSNVSVNFQDTVVGSVTYRAYTVDGMEVTRVPECPQVPMQLLQFSVPYNAKNIAVQVTGGQSQTTGTLPFKIIPAIRDRMICDTLPEVLTADSTVYHTNAYYPANAAEMVGEGFYMGENHIVTVAAYPIQYNPVTNKIKRNKRVNYTITYDLADASTSNIHVRDDFTLRQQGWDEVKTMVMNPNQVESFAPDVAVCQFLNMQYLPDSLHHLNDSIAYGGELYVLDTDPCEYMIITTQELAPSFRRLAALKRQKGLTTEIHCIENILNNPFVQCGDSIANAQYPIKDDAGKLRQYLRLAHKYKSTKYVLFGGYNVPFRYGYHGGYSDYYPGPYHVPTDWYYCDLTTNWNPDNRTENYGEYTLYNDTCIFDANPELFVGRLMCKTSEDVDNYIDKLLMYELNPGKGEASYLLNGFYFEYDGFHDKSIEMRNALAFQSKMIYQAMNFNPNHTGSSVINFINNSNCGYIGIFSHGNVSCFDVSKQIINTNDTIKTFIQALDNQSTSGSTGFLSENGNGLDNLSNHYKPGVLYTISCDVMPFDKPAINAVRPWNMGQAYTLCKNKGGIAFLGNTRSGFTNSSTRLGTFFSKYINGYHHIGTAEAHSKKIYFNSRYEDDKYIVMVHNLLGEPEVEMWTGYPSNYSGIDITRNNSSISVTGINSNNTIVAICGNSSNVQRNKATNGTAFFNNVSPNSSVMVYQHNYLPYIAPLYIQNETLSRSQYVIASDAYLGRNVDSNRTTGDVIIPTNVNYEMEYTGDVLLAPGFTVEKGATLSVVPSDY